MKILKIQIKQPWITIHEHGEFNTQQTHLWNSAGLNLYGNQTANQGRGPSFPHTRHGLKLGVSENGE